MSIKDTTEFGAATGEADRRSGLDRLGIHVLLEALLALAFAGALFWLYRGESALSTASGRDAAIVALVPLLLLGIAVAMTFRVGAVNLAAGAIAVVGAALFSENTERGLAVALLVAVGAALACGIVLAAVVVLLRAPGWLVSAGAAAVLWLWMFEHVNLAQLSADPLGQLPVSTAWIWLISVAALSIFAGVVGALNGWRSRLGACRDAATGPGDAKTKWVTATALTASAVLSGLAGVWVVWTAADGVAVVTGLNPLLITVFPVAAVLLGGTSALGRRGGVLGTVLASLLLMTLLLLREAHGWALDPLWILLSAIALGLVVTRLVEVFGGPGPIPAEPAQTERSTVELHPDPLPTRTVGEYDLTDIDPYRRQDFDGQR